ncbi:MAG: type III-B CRISPR module-associated Cmr3 family protein [Thermoguttaceae bacterium]
MNNDPMSITVTPRDPIITRDGRPFGNGDRVRSLDWIYPSVFAGSLRTLLGKQLELKFGQNDIDALKALQIRGPLPCVYGKLFVPKPLDCVVKDNKEKTYTAFAARPAELKNGEGTDLPDGLLPVLLPENVGDDFKPAKTNAFWSMAKMIDWLAKPVVSEEEYDETDDKTDKDELRTLAAPQQDVRTHIAMNADMGTAKDTMLFSSTGLDMMADKKGNVISLAAEITSSSKDFTDALAKLNVLHPLGGDKRLAHWKKADSVADSVIDTKIPEPLKQHKSATKIRMVLVTHALFSGGWRPGWIDKDTLEGTIPNCNGKDAVKVKLVGAVVDRWKPISGWSYEKGKHGPKPSRRLVPAGSVYFFEILDGKTFGDVPDSCWMQSVCDDEQDRNDGFGLAICGIWDRLI